MKKIPLTGLLAAGTTILAGGFLLPQVDAGLTYPVENTGSGWKWGVTLDYMNREVDRSEVYLSEGDPPRDWFVDYDDFDADLWGFTVFVTPPCFANTMIDFSYRNGDLDGRFTNWALDPLSEDFGSIYSGRAEFDRDEYEAGLTYPFPNLNWLYARAEWFYYTEDGNWNYGGTPAEIETQEYDMWGISAGLGAHQEYPLGASGLTVGLNGFLGLVYFDFEHKETTDPLLELKTDWTDWGFQGRVGARLAYPLQETLDVFLGVGYEYLDTDDTGLDMTNEGLFVNLGLKGEW